MNFNFVAEEEKKTVDFNEAISWAEKRKVDVINRPMNSIKISEKGELILDSEVVPTTEWAFIKMCKLLGIPKPFAYKIPEDLLLTVTHRLANEKKDGFLKLHRIDRGIIGITREKYDPIELKDSLIQLAPLDGKDLKVQEITYGDRGIAVNFLNDKLPVMEPEVGDITKIGCMIRNSDVGDVDLQARAFLYTLKCTNGAVLPNEWMCERRLKNKNLSKESSLIHFTSRLNDMKIKAKMLVEKFNMMGKINVTDRHLCSYWKGFKGITNEKVADDTFKISKEERKLLAAQVTARDKSNKESLITLEPRQADKEMDKTYYRIYWSITNAAKGFRADTCNRIYELAGGIVSDMLTYSKN